MVADQMLTFEQLSAPPAWPMGAELSAVIKQNPPGLSLDGWRFPASQCDAGYTSCTLPR